MHSVSAQSIPAATPRTDDVSYLRLARSRRVGPTTFHNLMRKYGTVAASLDALPEIAADAGVHDYQICPESAAIAELEMGRKAGARLLRHDSQFYPAALRQIPDAPPVLWLRGDPVWLSHNPVAVIGARNASSLGLRMARGMASGLGEAGFTVISGLARGVDTAAHQASVTTGTVAVLANGIDITYPAENTRMALDICENGAVISEQPPGVAPASRHFPARNRIISGLSRGVVVIEAAIRSGSLLTAQNALDQGREVMAVPGHPMDSRAGGCNRLIRDGAILVRSAADVCDILAREVETRDRSRASDADCFADTLPTPVSDSHQNKKPVKCPAEVESRVLSSLTPSPSDENDLIRELGLPATDVNIAIQSLELQGRLARLMGGRVALR